MKKSSEEYFEKAKTSFEKCEQIDSTDRSTLLSLKQIYAIKNNKEGLERIESKLKK